MSTAPHPRLLIEWESPVRAFCSAIRPALFSRSPRPLEVERAYTGVPGRALTASTLLHVAVVLLGLSSMPVIVAQLRSPLPADTREYKLTYLPSTEPAMEDTSGAEEGASGAPGGASAYYPAQVIRIARGPEQLARVHEAPEIPLPRNHSGLANLLVMPAALPPQPELAAMSLRSRPVHAPTRVDVVPPMASADLATPARPKLVLPAAEIIPPPPEVAASTKRSMMTEVVPPPPELSASTKHSMAVPAAEVVPPPPTLPAPVRHGAAAPAPDVVNPHNMEIANGGAAKARAALTKPGFVISSSPGDVVGVPGDTKLGTLAMSPQGHGSTGAGGSGGGDGLGAGVGPGSASAGDGPGSGKTGAGRGADALAHGGITSGAGPGGSGNGGTSSSGIVGVSIRGGPAAQPGVIYLASFGPSAPNLAGSKTQGVPQANPDPPLGPRRRPAVTVISTSNAGGGLGKYGALIGPRVYTTYLDTGLGTVVLEFSERRDAADPGFDGDLVAPDPLNLHVPRDLPLTRLIVAGTIDRNGVLRALRLLESDNADLAARIMAVMDRWRFRPVLRREEPVEVSAILGIRTR